MLKVLFNSYSEDDGIADNEEFINLLSASNSKEDVEDTKRYYSAGGDCWYDCDYVKVNDNKLQFYVHEPYLLCNFDIIEYPEHVDLIQKWWEEYNTKLKNFDYALHHGSLFDATHAEDYKTSLAAILYRGGSGYCYACFTLK